MLMRALITATVLLGGALADNLDEAVVGVDGTILSEGAPPPVEHVQSFEMEHSLGLGGPFTPRGTLDVITARGRSVKLSADVVLTGAEREELAATIAAEGLYRVRVRSTSTAAAAASGAGGRPGRGGGEEGGEWAVASLRVCDLVRSGFKEEIKLLLDLGAPAADDPAKVEHLVLGLDYRVPASKFAKAKDCHSPALLPPEVRFASAAGAAGATPAQALPVQPTDTDRRAPPGTPPQLVQLVTQALKGTTHPGSGSSSNNGALPGGVLNPDGSDPNAAQQQGFLRRYWYIILPLMILSMGGGAPPEEGAGSGAQQRAAAPPPSR